MIRHVRGPLVAREAEGAVVEVGGVGLLVRVSATTAAALPARGAEVALHAHLVVREDALDLYGFATIAERTLFEAFLGVSGVGARLALALCGVAPPEELHRALARGDSARLRTAPGVGKRIAERVVLELRDRLSAIGAVAEGEAGGAGDGAAGGGGDAFLQARDGLMALGFNVDEADAALADAAPDLDAERLVRHGLRALRRTP